MIAAYLSRYRIAAPLLVLLGALALASVPAQAETPRDTLVIAKDIADIITIAEGFSPRLVLNALTAGVASVVDRELVLGHERDGDLGTEWLRTNSAGSGPFRLSSWRAKDSVVLEAYPGYRRGPPGVQRVVLRHVSELPAQRRLLEAGEVDVARDLTPDLIAGLAGNAEVAVDDYPKGVVVYLAANASHPILGDDRVVQALRHAVDYHGMAESFLAGQFIVHQAFWPRGLWAAYTETPYRIDLARARSLLAQAGHGGGFAVRLDALDSPPFPAIAEAVRETLAQVGIEAQVVTQAGATLWPQYRAREHELILAPWSPDYVDPHANADAFARNPDNRPEAGLTGVLAWRNAWARDDLNAAVVEARDELDPQRRKLLYLDLQRRLQTEGPYVIMFQQTDQIARRTGVTGFVSGPNFDHVWYRIVTKDSASASPRG